MKSNDNFYLREAFQKLSLLENDFDITNKDVGVIDELKSFVADDIDAPVEERIIDVEADDVKDLQDTYVGKVILECDCCHSRIYKNQDEVVVDEEANLANVDEKCPVCNGEFGYKVIGKIEEFNDDANFEEKEDEAKDEIEDEVKDDAEEKEADDFDESFKAALTEALAELEEGCKKDEACEDCKDCDEACEEELDEAKKCGGYDCKKDKDIDDALDKLDDEEAKELDKHSAKAEALDEEDEKFPNPDKHEEVGEHNGVKMYKCNDCGKFAAIVDGKKVKKDSKEDLEAAIDAKDEALVEETAETPIVEEVVDEAKECCNDQAEEDKDKLEKIDESNENLGVKDGVNAGDDEKLEQDDAALAEAPLNEGVSIDMNNKQVNVDNEDVKVDVNNGVVEVGADAVDEVAPVADEMIAPLNDEEVAEIEANEPTLDANVEDDLGLDAAVDDAEVEVEDELPAEAEEEDEEDIDFDEFDDDAFADMGESYMKRVYGNVSSYLVENAKKEDGKLIVEGKVKFESGKEKATSFIFENARLTKRGKVVLEGHNEMFSRSTRAFALKGAIADNKFLGESLIYNYTASQLNEANKEEAVRVYGRVVKR